MSDVLPEPYPLEPSGNGKTVEHCPPDESLNADLDRALNKCKHRLTKEEEQQFLKVTLVELKTQILHIQERQGREKKLKNLTRVDTFLRVMGDWEEIVMSLTDGSCSGPIIWGLVKELLDVSKSESPSLFLRVAERIKAPRVLGHLCLI